MCGLEKGNRIGQVFYCPVSLKSLHSSPSHLNHLDCQYATRRSNDHYVLLNDVNIDVRRVDSQTDRQTAIELASQKGIRKERGKCTCAIL